MLEPGVLEAFKIKSGQVWITEKTEGLFAFPRPWKDSLQRTRLNYGTYGLKTIFRDWPSSMSQTELDRFRDSALRRLYRLVSAPPMAGRKNTNTCTNPSPRHIAKKFPARRRCVPNKKH